MGPALRFYIGPRTWHLPRPAVSKAAFIHMTPAQLCTENGVSIYMCSAVKIALLAQNVWYSTIGVRGGGVGGSGRPPGLKNFQGKLCFQGNRKFLKSPES